MSQHRAPSGECDHPDCGALCDIEIVDTRPDGLVSEARASYHEYSGGRRRASPEIRQLLASGRTIRQVAATLDDDQRRVVDDMARLGLRDLAAYLHAEELLRQGATTYGDIVGATGISLHQVKHLAQLIGMRSQTATNLANGEGRKLTVEHKAEALRLRSACNCSRPRWEGDPTCVTCGRMPSLCSCPRWRRSNPLCQQCGLYREGWTWRRIADHLGFPPSTLKMALTTRSRESRPLRVRSGPRLNGPQPQRVA